MNGARAQMIAQQMQSATGTQRISLEYRYTRELLRQEILLKLSTLF